MILFVASLPIQIFIAIMILIASGFPILFIQKRVGKDGKTFTLYKFRTMEPNADRVQKKFKKFNEASGPVFKIHNDPRFTRFGRVLNHIGLDELPQLWNVVKGDMALFGPRPLPVDEEKKLKKWQKKREVIKPGIISPWIFEGYHQKSFDEWMKSDIAYAEGKSFTTDCILFRKSVVFMGKLFLHEMQELVS